LACKLNKKDASLILTDKGAKKICRENAIEKDSVKNNFEIEKWNFGNTENFDIEIITPGNEEIINTGKNVNEKNEKKKNGPSQLFKTTIPKLRGKILKKKELKKKELKKRKNELREELKNYKLKNGVNLMFKYF